METLDLLSMPGDEDNCRPRAASALRGMSERDAVAMSDAIDWHGADVPDVAWRCAEYESWWESRGRRLWLAEWRTDEEGDAARERQSRDESRRAATERRRRERLEEARECVRLEREQRKALRALHEKPTWPKLRAMAAGMYEVRLRLSCGHVMAIEGVPIRRLADIFRESTDRSITGCALCGVAGRYWAADDPRVLL